MGVKKGYPQKVVTLPLLACTDLHEILHEGSSSRRNQPCQILSQSDQGF